MLEAIAHQQLKNLLQKVRTDWPHHLTLSRLVARSLRRKDSTFIQLEDCTQDEWWLGLMVPLCLESRGTVLVLQDDLKSRLLKIELPRLQSAGFNVGCWEGVTPPMGDQIWLLNHSELINIYKNELLGSRQLIIPEADLLSQHLRDAMTLKITSEDWERFRRANSFDEESIMCLFQKLTRSVFQHPAKLPQKVRIDGSEISCLQDLLGHLENSPFPWPLIFNLEPDFWASWAELDHKMLNWDWFFKPIEPLKILHGLLSNQPSLLITRASHNHLIKAELQSAAFAPNVVVNLSQPHLKDPIPLYLPFRQPLPNTAIFADHLLDQSRRLILGRPGITILLLDDYQLRMQLTSQLAAEFGQRVSHETTSPEENGVVSSGWDWWLHHHRQLPLPEQLIIALLPLPSLESPFIAARVEALKREGRDWFRDYLLPEALSVIPDAVTPVRNNNGRLAILDGRLRARSWGEEFLSILEPWTPLQRLLPD